LLILLRCDPAPGAPVRLYRYPVHGADFCCYCYLYPVTSFYPLGKKGDRCPVDNFDLNLGIQPRCAKAAATICLFEKNCFMGSGFVEYRLTRLAIRPNGLSWQFFLENGTDFFSFSKIDMYALVDCDDCTGIV
jgi:hypothetical protein